MCVKPTLNPGGLRGRAAGRGEEEEDMKGFRGRKGVWKTEESENKQGR